MKNLKKALALVLAIALCFSLVTVAGAANNYDDYADASTVEAEDALAVNIVTGLNIINGKENNKLDLSGNLTRAEAAKILTVLNLGTKLATSVNSSSVDTGFSDTKGNWASGYIAYCANKSYLTGSNGKFDPNGQLTGYAFGKMLLNVLGYGLSYKIVDGTQTTINSYEGTQWAINVAVDGNKIGLFANVDSELSGAITRVDAMNMVFNALEQANKLVKGTAEQQKAKTSYYALAEEFEYTKSATGTADAFGRPITTYTNGKDGSAKVTYATATETPAFTFTTAMTEKEIFAAIGADGIQGSSDKYIVMDKIYVNGAIQGEAQSVGNGQYDKADSGDARSTVIVAKNDTSDAAGFGNGVTVEIFATSTDNHYIMVSYNEYLGTVSAVTAANDKTGTARTITISNDGNGGSFETTDFAKNDVVLYTKANGVVKSVKLASTVTGTVTKVTSAGVYTIGGVDYKLSNDQKIGTGADAEAIKTALAENLKVGTTGTWYVDSCNNLIGTKEADTATVWKYGYLIGYQSQKAASNNLLGTGAKEAAEKFQIITSDGTTTVFDGAFKTDSNGDVTTFVWPGANDETPAAKAETKLTDAEIQLVRYTLDSNGKIDAIETIVTGEGATGVNGANNTKLDVTKGSAKVDSKYVTDSTVFIVYQDATHYAVYTGYKNVPTTTAAAVSNASSYSYFYAVKNSATDKTTIAAVVLKVANANPTSDADYVFVASTDKTVEKTSDATITTYTNVYMNGTKGSLIVTNDATPLEAGTLYTYTTDTKTGYATVSKVDGAVLSDVNSDKATSPDAVKSIQGGYFVYSKTGAETVIYTDSSTKYYQINATTGAVETVDGLEELGEDYTVRILFVDGTDSDSSDPATTVYFTIGAVAYVAG